MKFHFIRNEELSNIDVEIESSGLVGGDGGYHRIKFSNPCSMNIVVEDKKDEDNAYYPRLESLDVVMKGDWEFSETIDALKYIVKCFEEIRGDQHGFGKRD